MNYLIYIIMSILTIYLFIYIKDELKLLKIISIIAISSGMLNIIIGLILNYFIKINLFIINTSKITSTIFSKFLRNSIIFSIVGLLFILVYTIISYINKKHLNTA